MLKEYIDGLFAWEDFMENLKTVSELVSIKSFDTNVNKEIIDYLIFTLKNNVEEIVKIKSDSSNKNNLVVGVNTKLKDIKNVIVLSGHIDTVVADEGKYATNPFEAVKVNDKLFGLGIIDMKCFFASIIDNIKKIKKLKTPVVISISCDEETTLEGVKKITEFFQKQNIVPGLTIVGEPTSMKFCFESKSCYEYEIEIFGKSCHSSSPENGINANYIAAKIMIEIEKLNGLIEGISLSCGVVSGGRASNIVPNYASLKFDIRSKTKLQKDKVIFLIEEKIEELKNEYKGSEIKLNSKLVIPPLENKNSDFLNALMVKYDIEEGEFKGGCEAGFFQELGGETVIFGTGDLELAHKPNEFMIIKKYFEYNQLLMQILNDYCQK